MSGRLEKKVAIVTGGASGLGAAIVRRFTAEGAIVVATDILEPSPRDIGEDGTKCHFLLQDVTQEDEWGTLVRRTEDRYGALHILVNSAGITGPFDASNPENTRLSDWQTIHRVNVEGTFLGCRAAIPAIRRSGGGAITNLSSTAGIGATPDYLAYGASKAAVLHMTRSIALHCARDGSRVRCNSVHPAIVVTPMFQGVVSDIARRRGLPVEQVMSEFRSAIPQGEFQDAEDVASAILFLSSDEARHITGLAMVVDGASTLGVQR